MTALLSENEEKITDKITGYCKQSLLIGLPPLSSLYKNSKKFPLIIQFVLKLPPLSTNKQENIKTINKISIGYQVKMKEIYRYISITFSLSLMFSSFMLYTV
jgi:hypothetical protein